VLPNPPASLAINMAQPQRYYHRKHRNQPGRHPKLELAATIVAIAP
jgi:hypothetical protein